MNTAIMRTALALVLSGGFAGQAIHAAGPKPKHSPAHDAAVQKCTDGYEAAAAAAHAPNSPTGKVRLQAMHAAAVAKERCIAKAPK
jgi:hypothetical protein